MTRAIAGHGSASPDFEQAWQVERIQEAIRLSSAERCWVKVSAVD